MTLTALPTFTEQPVAPTLAPSADVVYVPAPAGVPADAPRVFAAINAVMRDAMPVGKNQTNTQQNYKFRGIDDVMSAMAGPLRAHGVFILPTIAEHQQQRDGKMTRTLITMRYRVYGPAGDCLVADVPGEAFDYADKATNKAQSAALKYLLFTLFMLPVDGRSIDDGDRHHPEPTPEQRSEQQQRQQDRRQQRGQGQQQRGPHPARKAAQQAPAGPRRDYLAEAQAAQSREEFNKVRADAVAAGAPADYLARLDQVAAQKRAAAVEQPVEERRGPIADAPRRAMEWTKGAPAAAQPVDQDQERAAALGEMFDAGWAAGVPDHGEVEELFSAQHGVTPAEATVEQLRDMRDDLLDAAKGARA
ncbi:ERF family protein [Streptomyces noursei]|uniref:ERF family protein n=1 Tax=Streptomyces noursei TaxID=1971 RepID=UPI0023B83538|nr:ERF family protein [Streptomyces noursei]